MSNHTTSPNGLRPAALLEAMAAAVRTYHAEAHHAELAIGAAIAAASVAGFVLIPRAELEEAAEALDDARFCEIASDDPDCIDLANRLRQRSRG